MNRYLKPWACLLLVLCLLSGAVPAVAASGLSAVVPDNSLVTGMKKTAEGAGFSAVGEAVLTDAGTIGGAVDVQLPLSDAADQSIVAAVQAVDANGRALDGHSQRYILADRQGDTAMASVQEPGCRYFVILPVQGSLEQGWVTDLTAESQLTDQGYETTLSAKLTMSKDLALFAAMYPSSQMLKNIRVTCSVESPLLLGMDAVDTDQIPSDLMGIYTLAEAKADPVKGRVQITYRISDTALRSWSTMSSKDIMDQLTTTELEMAYTRMVSPEVIQQGANHEGKLFIYGQVSVTNGDGSQPIPGVGLQSIVVPAKLTEISAAKLTGLPQVELSAEKNELDKVDVTVDNQEPLALGGSLLCTAYDEDGKMLGYSGTYAAVKGESQESFEIPLPVVSGTICKVKVMLLDAANGCAPVCKAVEVRW